MSQYVYKFTHQKWAEHMINHGSIRIGTLYDYWKKTYQEGVRDEREGKIYRYTIIECLPSDPPLPTWGTSFFHIPPGFGTIRNASASNCGKDTIPDMYVYSTTLSDSDSFFAGFGSSYDTCVKIGPLDEFRAALTATFNQRLKASCFDNSCQYGIREVTYNRGVINVHPALMKDASYANQQEHRFVGETHLVGIKPKIVWLAEHKHLFQLHKKA